MWFIFSKCAQLLSALFIILVGLMVTLFSEKIHMYMVSCPTRAKNLERTLIKMVLLYLPRLFRRYRILPQWCTLKLEQAIYVPELLLKFFIGGTVCFFAITFSRFGQYYQKYITCPNTSAHRCIFWKQVCHQGTSQLSHTPWHLLNYMHIFNLQKTYTK